MNILLDTHAFLWFVDADRRLSRRAVEIMSDPKNELFLSTASAWEIVIKSGTGALKLAIEPERFIAEQLSINAITPLPIALEHVLAVARLPQHHRDPFDRVIIAQAKTEELPIITSDRQIREYSIETIW
jgi:PIN domain nuclease of toxin-antitoxin system